MTSPQFCGARPAVRLLSVCLLGFLTLPAAALALTFTTIDVPGASYTAASGINSAGQIVGVYTDSA